MDFGMRVVSTVLGALIGFAMTAIGVFCSAPANGAAALTPQDFAYGMPIMATEVAAAYSVQLPVDVYKSSVHGLGDVRVFNAQGEALPYVIQQGPPRINWSTLVITGKADPNAPGDYDFDLGASFPLQRVNLILPEKNSVYLLDFKSRAQQKDPWREVIRAGVYRRASADGEDFNGPIEVPLNRDRYWRVHLSGENSSGVPLRFEGSFSPSELEFVAHGSPPYLLAYGSSSVGAAATDLSAIPAGTLISTASLGSRSALGGAGRIAAAGSPFDKRYVLWAVLVMGVAALAARLARNRRRAGR
jgi:hypothetical protein